MGVGLLVMARSRKNVVGGGNSSQGLFSLRFFKLGQSIGWGALRGGVSVLQYLDYYPCHVDELFGL